MSRVPKFPWSTQVPMCLGAQVPKCPEYPSAWVPFECRVSQLFECLGALKCPWSALGMHLQCWSTFWMSLEWPLNVQVQCPLSALLVKMVCNIIWNGLLWEFFKNTSELKFYRTHIVWNKMCIIWKAQHSLKKLFKYLNIQDSLRSENLIEYYLCKEIFFSLHQKIRTK